MAEAARQLPAGEGEGARQLAGEAARETARPALDLTVSHGGSTCSLKIEDTPLATVAVGFGFGALICLKLDSRQLVQVAVGLGVGAGLVAGVGALAYFWQQNREITERAIREALEGRPAAVAHAPDPVVQEIRRGSLLIKLRCHTQQSFTQFIRDHESEQIKLRLQKELSKVGFTEEFTITIENMEEVEAQKLRYVSVCSEQSSWLNTLVQDLSVKSKHNI